MWQKKTKIKTDIGNKKTLTHRFYHVTTTDYYKPYISKFIEIVPDSEQKIKLQDFVRVKPMVVPIMGSAKIRHMLYFVPMRLIQKSFISFDTGELHHFENSVAIPFKVRTFKMSDLKKVFLESEDPRNEPFISRVSTGRSDFLHYQLNQGSTTDYDYQSYVYTTTGRKLVNILNQLGYRIDWMNTNDGYDVSALPLLAYSKIYLDHMRNTAYNNLVDFNNVEIIINRNSASDQDLSAADLLSIFKMLYYINYDADIFVSAFDNPAGPNSPYINNRYKINDITINDTYQSEVNVGNNGTPQLMGLNTNNHELNATPYRISQYILTSLHKLSDFMARHQITGHDKLNNYLAQFGVAPTAEQLNMVKFLGKCESPINFDDIFSTADTNGAILGQFAGRGWARNNGEFINKTNERGYLVDIAVIIPKVAYAQGMQRHVFHINRLDFWNPTFDALGNTPVQSLEVFVPQRTGLSVGQFHDIINGYNKVFGFLPKDYEYKEIRSDLSGEFLLDSMRTEMDSWHLFRMFEFDDFFERLPQNQAVYEVKHGFRFTEANFDRDQYDRAFQTSKNDNFIVITNYELEYTSNMKALYDTYDYESVGKEIEVELAGSNQVTK